jgi:uncharacterized membrane protein YgcG
MLNRALQAVLSPTLVIGLVSGLAISAGCRRETVARPVEAVRVLDAAGVLSERQRMSIADYLEFVESERGVDYRVVVMDEAKTDLVREGVSRYERLRIGESTGGEGLLLLVNVGSREARVEVGYDLEHRVRDVEASSMIREFLAPYFASGEVASGIEASVERLVDVLEPSRQEPAAERPFIRSGGAGATEALLKGIDRLTPETKARLEKIMVPQAAPEDCVELEMALMHRGIYHRDVPMYDEAWRRANRPALPARRLKEIAREWDGPFEVKRVGDHAIAYFTGEKALRWGPQFLRRTDDGWIVDASLVARFIVYDYSNQHWYAVEDDYPYLAIIQSVYSMQRGSLRQRGPVWVID